MYLSGQSSGLLFRPAIGGLVGGIGEGGGGPNVEEGLDAFGVLGGLGRRVSREWWFREVQVSTILSGSEVNRGLENGWLEAVRCFTDLS